MITPHQASQENDKIHAEALAAAEAKIDKALKSRYFTGGKISLPGNLYGLDYNLRKKLIDRYRKAGWTVEHFSDQRDGDYYYFSAK